MVEFVGVFEVADAGWVACNSGVEGAGESMGDFESVACGQDSGEAPHGHTHLRRDRLEEVPRGYEAVQELLGAGPGGGVDDERVEGPEEGGKVFAGTAGQ